MSITGVALKFLTIPFFWIGLAWAMVAFTLAALAPQVVQVVRSPIVFAGSFFLSFALGELYLANTNPLEVDRSVTPPLYQADLVLGWVPVPSHVFRATAKHGRTIIYDVSYSIDSVGNRISPPDRGNQRDGCLLFFADSFIFGLGVSDHETIPYQVGLKTRGRFRVVNVAAGGYGAEQMLAIMQRGNHLATRLSCEPTHIIYAAQPHHIHRAAGTTDYSKRGPRYRQGPNNVLEYLGTNPNALKPVSDSGLGSRLRLRLAAQIWKSRIYRTWAKRSPQTTEAQIELYFAIVREAYRLFEHRWPKAELHIISWDIHDFYSNGQARFHRGIKSVGAKVHFIDDILPDYTKDPLRYGLHQFDLHPNPLAHEMVASYLVDRLALSTQTAKP